MNGIELFELIKSNDSIDKLLQSIPDDSQVSPQSKYGNIVEKVWDIIIKFGIIDKFAMHSYDHYEGNINTNNLKKIVDLEKYIKRLNVYSKGKGGSSDITLQNKLTSKWIFISSKFYLDDSTKSIDEYDVEKILAVIKKYEHVYTSYEIYLLVNNKQKVLDIIASSQLTNEYITENIHHILDFNDLKIYFQNLKKCIHAIQLNQVNSIFCDEKVHLQLRFHQDLITHNQMQKINEGCTDLLLGAKARSGKTYCVGALLIKYFKKYGILNGLIVTPAPTETLSQFTDGMLTKFRDFNDINIIEIKQGRDFNEMALHVNNIIIVSKQLLDSYVLDSKIKELYDLNLNFIIFDENHFHGTTQMSKNILDSYAIQSTIKLYLTATYSKSLHAWNIEPNCRFYWDIEDEQLCKNRDILGLTAKHANVSLFLTEENMENLLKVYDDMPDLHILTTIMDSERYSIIKEKIKDTSYGFSNSTLLSGNFPGEVDTILKYITGSEKEIDYPKKDLSIFGRIKKIAIGKGSRTTLTNADFTTQLWFLPFGVDMTIESVSEHLKDRMLYNTILRNFEIKIVNSKKDYKLSDIKNSIYNWEVKAKSDGKDGLILLAGNQLTLGITLPFVDIVFLLNDITSSDKIVQMMFRCMTEKINTPKMNKINSKKKKMGFVVDFNISRVLTTCLEYGLHTNQPTPEKKLLYLIENNLINIDSDLFESKENKTKLVEKLLNVWKDNPSNSLKILLKRIEDSIIDLDTTDQQILNKYFTSSTASNTVNIKIKFDDESCGVLPNGKEKIKIEKSLVEDTLDNVEVLEGKEDEPEDFEVLPTNVSFTKDLLPFILPLSCILTINKDNNDILEMLNIIKTNPELLTVFQDQSFIWWNNLNVINLLENILYKYVKVNSDVYNIAFHFKISLQNLIDNPKELLELIDSCLKPKQKEKQENGEVFTPMPLVFEMLDNLDNHYIKVKGVSIFSNPNFKWFDPAAGMGNFSIGVYIRLMDALRNTIPDVNARKRHILQRMIYMSELNKKNVFIIHQIFNINNEYTLNLHEGDTLKLNIGECWDSVDNFDIVLGNPPYNKGGIRSHTGKQLGAINETIWTKFIEISLELLAPNGFLAFINPLSWLKKSHSLHTALLENYIIWLKIWDNSQSKKMINADIPISLYILQNRINNLNKKTKIVSILKRRSVISESTEYLDPNFSTPLAFHNIFNKLIVFINKNKLQLEYKTKTVKSTGPKIKLPTKYELGDMWVVDTYTLKDGILVKKALDEHPDTYKRKLIIANKSSFTGAFIDEGALGLTGNDKFYVMGANLEIIKKLLSFKIMDVICHFTKYRQDFLEKEAFTYIPDIRKLGITDITESEFYNLIGLTSQEIKQVISPSKTAFDTEDLSNEFNYINLHACK